MDERRRTVNILDKICNTKELTVFVKEFTAKQFGRFLGNAWPFLDKGTREETTAEFPDGRIFVKNMDLVEATMKKEGIKKVTIRIPA
jgi:hypothetical protein